MVECLRGAKVSSKVSLLYARSGGSRGSRITAALASPIDARFTLSSKRDVAIELRVPYLKFVPASILYPTYWVVDNFTCFAYANVDDDERETIEGRLSFWAGTEVVVLL
jgi:hypothetical protein